jgi:hypothetical protein
VGNDADVANVGQRSSTGHGGVPSEVVETMSKTHPCKQGREQTPHYIGMPLESRKSLI